MPHLQKPDLIKNAFQVNSRNSITCVGLWSCLAEPSLHCQLRQSLPATHPQGCSHHPAPSRLPVGMMSPALASKTALYRRSKCLALAAISNSGSAVVGQGDPAEHPGVTRALSGKTLMPGSEGGKDWAWPETLRCQVTQWVSRKGCSDSWEEERAVFPEA